MAFWRRNTHIEKERHVKANARDYNDKFSYADNRIKTSKYNIFTFLPINLFEQFQRVANAYFLVLLILQVIPEISSLSWFTTIVPLVLVLVITAVKDATDDYFRHKSDQQVNNRQSQVLIRGSLQNEKWMNVRVGDIIRLENNQFVAADILLLCSSEPYGLCYIETAELDGETNLKVRQALTVTSDLKDITKLMDFDGEEFQSNAVFSGFLTFWSYIIILNTVVPISLYVSVEVLRLGHSYFINWDQKMFCRQTNTAAEARTTTLNEELGQVEFIFSDKTGTLTQNIMVFSKCSINGQTYGFRGHHACVDFSFNPLCDKAFKFYDGSLIEAIKLEDLAVQEFFRLLALCHTVMPEEKRHLVYLAQSPDEGALVTAARNFGFVFRARTPETITLCEMGRAVTYQLLAILDFNNVRKRMSVIVRNPQGQIKLYCKGADTIIFDRLDPSSEEFAGEGLRTLALAYKDLDEDDFEVWMKKLLFASTVIENREDQLAVLYEEIEQGLKLLGATAIEDKLQEGVPETIACLNLADIKIWVLTGDKLETAMNIGYSCNMLRDDMNEYALVINGHSLVRYSTVLRYLAFSFVGIIIPSSVLLVFYFGSDACRFYFVVTTWLYCCLLTPAHALEPQLEHILLDLACLCKTVICCRVTPLQKAQVVELVKRHKRAVTLAIGDGANDVSMIKTAHIGVGISGQEGMQAVLASDYSFAQFRYLQRLLLVHGRWSYFRMCNFLCYFFYKNFAFTLVHFWYGFFCGFSAQTVYDQWFITLFNIVYTSLPVLAMGLFDQDVNDQNSLRYPSLYKPGQQNLLFNKRQFFLCTLQGMGTSFLLFFIPYGAFSVMVKEDGSHFSDQQTFAVTIATTLVIVVSVQIGLDKHYWTAVNHLFIWGSLTVYFAILFAMQSNGIFGIFPSNFPFVGTARNCLSEKSVWLVILLTTVVCVVPGLVVSFLRVDLFPTLTDKSRKKEGPQEQNLRRVRRTSSRRSAYAFSHQQGYGELITSGKNMKMSTVSSAGSPGRTPHSSTWIENMLKRKNEVSCTSDESGNRAKQTPKQQVRA
uniref:Phospholipid-transporting ATPase n=1 Tax=Dicentrarchus labrax TaxID=13489 RepID=A0A8C4EVF5_DICLA